MAPLLEIDRLSVRFTSPDGEVWAVRDVNLTLEQGRCLALVGESGCGKSATTTAAARLAKGAQVSGSVQFEGKNLLALPESEMRTVRGGGIGMVFQDPMTGLHPAYRVGRQIVEAIRAHKPVSREEARRQAVRLLSEVGIPDASSRMNSYPHELSGGQRQRVMIAIAIAASPRLLIADEPTTALDVTVQAQILQLLSRLQRDRKMAILLVTHDLGVVAEVADDVAVMYAGRIVEQAPVDDIFSNPRHPYTRGLLQSLPIVGSRAALTPIQGSPPSPLTDSTGCSFSPRCPLASTACLATRPLLREVAPDHSVACVTEARP